MFLEAVRQWEAWAFAAFVTAVVTFHHPSERPVIRGPLGWVSWALATAHGTVHTFSAEPDGIRR